MAADLGTDFLDAHQRHWHDAELLLQHQRWANADQLYGLVAECGLKRLMQAFGMPMQNGVPKKSEDRVHANDAWDRYESYQSRTEGVSYPLPANNPFDNWHISQRYAVTSAIDSTRAQTHQNGAWQICLLIQQATQDGLLP